MASRPAASFDLDQLRQLGQPVDRAHHLGRRVRRPRPTPGGPAAPGARSAAGRPPSGYSARSRTREAWPTAARAARAGRRPCRGLGGRVRLGRRPRRRPGDPPPPRQGVPGRAARPVAGRASPRRRRRRRRPPGRAPFARLARLLGRGGAEQARWRFCGAHRRAPDGWPGRGSRRSSRSRALTLSGSRRRRERRMRSSNRSRIACLPGSTGRQVTTDRRDPHFALLNVIYYGLPGRARRTPPIWPRAGRDSR